MGAGGRGRRGVARTEVTFRALEPAEIDLYLASGEWRDRAGAYAIQGLGSILIDADAAAISPTSSGLPIALLLQLEPNIVGTLTKP